MDIEEIKKLREENNETKDKNDKTGRKIPCCRLCKHCIQESARDFFCDVCRDYISYDRVNCINAREQEHFCGHDGRFYDEVPNVEAVIPYDLWNIPWQDPEPKPEPKPDPKPEPKPEPMKKRSWWERLLLR